MHDPTRPTDDDPPEAAEPAPSPARSPFDAAEEALMRAAAARGVRYEPAAPPEPPKGPLERAADALASAEAARRHAERGGTAGIAREEAAREQLEALKRGGGGRAQRPEDPAAKPAASPKPRKRDL